MSTPIVTVAPRTSGVAGQYGYHVTLDYADGQPPEKRVFIGSAYSNYVMIQRPNGEQEPIAPSVVQRCGGHLTANWIRCFYKEL